MTSSAAVLSRILRLLIATVEFPVQRRLASTLHTPPSILIPSPMPDGLRDAWTRENASK